MISAKTAQLLYMISGVLLLAGMVCIVAGLVCKLRKKPKPALYWVALGLLTAGLEPRCINRWRLYDTLQRAGTLTMLLAGVLAVLLVIQCLRRKRKLPLLITAVVYLLCGFLMLQGGKRLEELDSQRRREAYAAAGGYSYSRKIQTEVGFDIVDGTEPLEVTASTGSEKHGYTVYESCDLGLVFGDETATAADCQKTLAANKKINKEFKAFFSDFIDRMAKTYPDMDFRILNHNLKTLQVIVCSREEYMGHSVSFDSYGCYVQSENTIYIPEGTEYIEGEFGFQVLLHEFCHAARNSNWENENGKTERTWYWTTGLDYTVLEEAMNSAFSCSLLNYYERDIAYQLPSNYLRIMLECMDNFTLADYINHSEAYFCRKLDEYAGYTNYAFTIWKLIDLQRNDYLKSDIDIPAEDFYPIYDFLCELYYPTHITADMSYEQAKAVADELVDKAFYDVPEECKKSPERFYENLDTYLETMSADTLHAA